MSRDPVERARAEAYLHAAEMVQRAAEEQTGRGAEDRRGPLLAVAHALKLLARGHSRRE